MYVVRDVGAFSDESDMLNGRYIVNMRVVVDVEIEAMSMAESGVEIVGRNGGYGGSILSTPPGDWDRGLWSSLTSVSPIVRTDLRDKSKSVGLKGKIQQFRSSVVVSGRHSLENGNADVVDSLRSMSLVIVPHRPRSTWHVYVSFASSVVL